MWDFIAKYWLQVLFGLVVTIVSARYKKIKNWWKEIKDEKEKKKKAERMAEVKACIDELKPMLEDIAKQSIEGDTSLREEIDSLNEKLVALNNGILAIQGDNFKAKCRTILKDEKTHIDFKTFENLRHDHNAYKALGGNSDGDELFELVKHRYENQQV